MKKAANILSIILVCVCAARVCAAAEARFERPAGYVNDYAGVLSRGAKAEIEALLGEVEKKTTAEVAVVTVKTTSPLTIEQYAVELFRKWGIGKKGADNGVLLLLAVSDRRVRIEVGYGLEDAITDADSSIIIDRLMVPAFQKGGYDLGIASGVVPLVKIIRDKYGVQLDISRGMPETPDMPARGGASAAGSLLTLLFFILIFGFRFGSLFFLMGSGGGYWSGGGRGSFGGGFGGFGGGSSGGGGASGSW
ncbi:MAG: TPM domain-containing protein [Candidatus Omnitrophota bacterium]